jgi:hypothetical protein
MLRHLLVVGLAPVLGAGCAYTPGSFDHPFQSFPGSRVTLDCLDVAVELARDPQAAAPVLGYTIGNRCDRAARVDLSSIAVRGTTREGRRTRLVPFDPDRELRPLWLEARSFAREQIEYRDPAGDPLEHGVCADVGRMAGGAGESWLCFEDVRGGAS